MLFYYIFRRIYLMIPTLFIVSVITFLVIEAPPGDFVTSYIGRLESQGVLIDELMIENLKARYAVDSPLYVRYTKWLQNLVTGNLGTSMVWTRTSMQNKNQKTKVELDKNKMMT